ncbi:hypothetical protein C5O77_00130 (plasmid) [Limosilactobacillus reuteri]|uniref:4'-phosphopantetheinyl transferase domain-containing protein n=1 Tax=Limosilactobacillus reuteri TaxID=1598 RepID=A0A3M6SHX5_LIMRT|nr:4'-phosphopantetheinyl transferase superfamily protein [Limosilactobacillus reuteri]RMX27015.1 hypothetical protein C5O77_00130 [Limosilactobacillus reuteri]
MIWINKIKRSKRFFPVEYQLYEVERLTDRNYQYLEKFLTIPEKKGKQYHSKNKKVFRNYLLGRIICKSLLSQKLNLDPHKISILANQDGVPIVYTARLCTDIKVSISHSGNMIFVACVKEKNVGIDCQETKALLNNYNNEFMFTQLEINSIEKRKTALEKLKICTLIWSIKESFVKLQCEGFTKAPACTKIIELEESKVKIKDEDGKVHFLNYSYEFLNGYCLVSIKK